MHVSRLASQHKTDSAMYAARPHGAPHIAADIYIYIYIYCRQSICERGGSGSRAGRKSGERERSGERTFNRTLERERSVELPAAERRTGVTKIGLSAERQIGRSPALTAANLPVVFSSTLSFDYGYTLLFSQFYLSVAR